MTLPCDSLPTLVKKEDRDREPIGVRQNKGVEKPRPSGIKK
jgi:hypothetical protein